MPGMDGTGPLWGGGMGCCGQGRRSGYRRVFSNSFQTDLNEGRYSDTRPAGVKTQNIQSAVDQNALAAELAELRERSAAVEVKLSELTKMVQRLSDTKFDVDDQSGNVKKATRTLEQEEVEQPVTRNIRPSRILCKPPKGCKLEAPERRFFK